MGTAAKIVGRFLLHGFFLQFYKEYFNNNNNNNNNVFNFSYT